MKRLLASALLFCLPATAGAAEFYYTSGSSFGIRGRVVKVLEVFDESNALVRRSVWIDHGSETGVSVSSANYYDLQVHLVGEPDWFALVDCPGAVYEAGAEDGTDGSYTYAAIYCPSSQRGACVSASGSMASGQLAFEGPHSIPVAASFWERADSLCNP